MFCWSVFCCNFNKKIREKCRKKFVDNYKFGCDNNSVIYRLGDKIET